MMNTDKLLKDMSRVVEIELEAQKMRIRMNELKEEAVTLANVIDEGVHLAALDDTIPAEDRAKVFKAFHMLTERLQRPAPAKVEEVRTIQDVLRNLPTLMAGKRGPKM